MQKILIGTNNPSKWKVIASFLADMPVECVSPAQLGLEDVPPETAGDAAGNALQKALAWHRLAGLPVITEDSGLVFLDLPSDHPDQPGVMVRRPHGYTMDDDEMLAYYQQIAHRHGGRIRFAWQDAWCVLHDEKHYTFYVEDEEIMNRHARIMVDRPCEARLPGWPLDSLTYLEHLGKYKAELRISNMHADMEKDAEAAKRDMQVLKAWLRRQFTT